jgi:hypothetical protein
LKTFNIPIISWCQSHQAFKEFQEKKHITYTIPDVVKLHGKDWHKIAGYGVNNELVGACHPTKILSTLATPGIWCIVSREDV